MIRQPIVVLSAESRCVVTTDCALAYGERETWQYTPSILRPGDFHCFKGIKNSYQYYTSEVGETA